MTRTHVALTAEPIQLWEVNPADEKAQRGHKKPAGFWYEVNGEWRKWCRTARWGLSGLIHLFKVELNDCQVLKINTLAKLDQFHLEYGYDSGLLTPDFPDTRIDWGLVGQQYDGLEIAPYQGHRFDSEFDMMWYYGWDIASGVIWRPRNAAVTYLRPLRIKKEAHSVAT